MRVENNEINQIVETISKVTTSPLTVPSGVLLPAPPDGVPGQALLRRRKLSYLKSNISPPFSRRGVTTLWS